jgi:inositol-phosphate phosphatase / L-galactose 1-phosphate phosphatase / histidinol-phosphatase
MDYDYALKFANKLAEHAGVFARKYYRTYCREEVKEDRSVVSIADQMIEHDLRAQIVKEFPTHGILGEEEDSTNLESDYVWVLDPIDGTASFVLGRPLFGILIGLLYKGKPILGLIDQPITNERWSAAGNTKAFYNNQEIKVSSVNKLENSKIILSDPYLFRNDFDKIWDLRNNVKVLAWEAECYSYGSLAMGTVDAVVKKGLSQYDFLPVVKIIENAGGIIVGKNYEQLDINYSGDVYAAATRELLDKIIEL